MRGREPRLDPGTNRQRSFDAAEEWRNEVPIDNVRGPMRTGERHGHPLDVVTRPLMVQGRSVIRRGVVRRDMPVDNAVLSAGVRIGMDVLGGKKQQAKHAGDGENSDGPAAETQ